MTRSVYAQARTDHKNAEPKEAPLVNLGHQHGARFSPPVAKSPGQRSTPNTPRGATPRGGKRTARFLKPAAEGELAPAAGGDFQPMPPPGSAPDGTQRSPSIRGIISRVQRERIFTSWYPTSQK